MNGLNSDELTKLIHDNALFHGMVSIGIVMDMTHIEKFAQLVAAAEREACAKICDSFADDPVYCGNLIRARGAK